MELKAAAHACLNTAVWDHGVCSESHYIIKCWHISVNISKTVQDRDTVTMED